MLSVASIAASALSILAFAFLGDPVGAQPAFGTSEGQLHEDFYLPRLDGTRGRLSDHRGRKVLLFHFASW